jgi:L-ascorbate metabolism protein UlaG (beta-lactamase superfamily)
MGSMLEFRSGGSAALRRYITGDTRFIDGFAEIPRRYPDVDAFLTHLGGTRVAGVLLTMEGAQGVEALRIVGPAGAVPIHYDDYTVFKSPLEDLRRAAQQPDLETQIVYVARGQTVTLDPARARSLGQQG